jgi:hypothetical protein
MMSAYSAHRSSFALRFGTVFILTLLVACAAMAQITGSSQSNSQENSSSSDKKADKSSEPATVKLQIHVSTKDDKPISEASVYVRFNESGGFLHHDKLAELDLKTNQEGTAKAPAIPQGKIMIQVIATGWHTYGQWYDINQSEQVIEIKLERPPRWY